MDLRRRESHHNKLSEKVSCIIETLKELDGDFDICNNKHVNNFMTIYDTTELDKTYRYILQSLYAFTLFVIAMVITSWME